MRRDLFVDGKCTHQSELVLCKVVCGWTHIRLCVEPETAHTLDLTNYIFGQTTIYKSNLSNLSFAGSDMSRVVFDECLIDKTDFTYVDLSGAVFTNCAFLDHTSLLNNPTRPTRGIFEMPKDRVVYKKAFDEYYHACIVALYVPWDAQVYGRWHEKCRVSKAVVFDIKCLRKCDNVLSCHSWFRHKFVYRVGETVTPDSFDATFVECGPGIHVLTTREEAVDWVL